MEAPIQVTHFLNTGNSSDDEGEVRELSREGIQKKPLTLDKLASDEEKESRERQEKEWLKEIEARLEARWNERNRKEEMGSEGVGEREDSEMNSGHGKWFAWRGYKVDELPKS